MATALRLCTRRPVNPPSALKATPIQSEGDLMSVQSEEMSREQLDDAMEDLWRTFSSRLRAFIISRVGNPADADDILQDVFVKIARTSSTLRDADRLTTWMFRIAHNAIIDHYRAAPRRRELPVDDVPPVSVSSPQEDAIDDPAGVRAQLASCVRPLLDQLPEPYREALELVELDGMAQIQAAEALGLSVSGMKSRVQRGRAKALEQLNDWCSVSTDARGGPVDCVPTHGSQCG